MCGNCCSGTVVVPGTAGSNSVYTVTDNEDGTSTVVHSNGMGSVQAHNVLNTGASVSAASAAGSDSFGNPYAVGSPVLTLSDGSTLAISSSVDTDTFATAEAASVAGTDSFGVAYGAGAVVLTLANGDTVARTQLQPMRDSVISSDPLDASAVSTAGSLPSTLLSATAGELFNVFLSADGSSLTTPVSVDILVGGSVVGTVVVPVGSSSSSPIPVALNTNPTAYGANAVATFRVVGDGSGMVSDIAVTYDFRS